MVEWCVVFISMTGVIFQQQFYAVNCLDYAPKVVSKTLGEGTPTLR